MRSHWLAWALELMLTDEHPDASPVVIELQTGDQPIVIETRDGAIHTRLGAADSPDATLSGPPTPILGLLLGLLAARRRQGRRGRATKAISLLSIGLAHG